MRVNPSATSARCAVSECHVVGDVYRKKCTLESIGYYSPRTGL